VISKRFGADLLEASWRDVTVAIVRLASCATDGGVTISVRRNASQDFLAMRSQQISRMREWLGLPHTEEYQNRELQ